MHNELPNLDSQHAGASRKDALVYIIASILTVTFVLPLALATQNTRQGLFDECFQAPCQSETRMADLD